MTNTKAAPADAFIAHLPEDPETPVVVSIPHAGIATEGYESSLAATLDVRCDADLFVDELYDGHPRGALVRARLSRFVCDLNRHPDDVAALAVPEHPAPQDTLGRGFLWVVTTTGARALAGPLSLAQWRKRQAIHTAYHAALDGALQRARQKFGFAILIDGHSMPSVGKTGHPDPGKSRADIVPGDRMGTSCAPALSATVGQHFCTSGFTVAFNEPYKGGFITTHHGRPQDGIHAIQIEMRRDLYMDEGTYERRPSGMARVSTALGQLLRTLDAFDPR